MFSIRSFQHLVCWVLPIEALNNVQQTDTQINMMNAGIPTQYLQTFNPHICLRILRCSEQQAVQGPTNKGRRSW